MKIKKIIDKEHLIKWLITEKSIGALIDLWIRELIY